jgi:hypothetical protein
MVDPILPSVIMILKKKERKKGIPCVKIAVQ